MKNDKGFVFIAITIILILMSMGLLWSDPVVRDPSLKKFEIPTPTPTK
jgi:hypothetical protein